MEGDNGSAKKVLILSKAAGSGLYAMSAIPSFCFGTFCAWIVGLEALALAASLPLQRTDNTVEGVLNLLNLGWLIKGVSSGMHNRASNCANRDSPIDIGVAALSTPGWPTHVGVEAAA